MCALRGMRDEPYEHIKTWDELSRPLPNEKNYYQRINKKRLWSGGSTKWNLAGSERVNKEKVHISAEITLGLYYTFQGKDSDMVIIEP